MSYQDFNTQRLKPPQRRLGFYKDFKPQGFNKGPNVSKTSHTFQAERLQDPILLKFYSVGAQGLRTPQWASVSQGSQIYKGTQRYQAFKG